MSRIASKAESAQGLSDRELRRVHQGLLDQHGPRHWWPADTEFEIMAGAILTQNTAWKNVEKALDQLRERDALSARAITALSHDDLAQAIRPSGYYNIKARRLRNFCEWYLEQGGFDALNQRETDTLRRELLSIKGVGPETADDILLYAFRRPVFVVDAYTFRIFERLGLIPEGLSYEELRASVENALGPEEQTFNELHALIVAHGNGICRPKPLCEDCGLRRNCAHASE